MPLNDEIEKFRGVYKLIAKTELSTNVETLAGYREKIIGAYNIFVKYISERYNSVDQESQLVYDEAAVKARDKFVYCLQRLQCTYATQNVIVLELIDEADIGPARPRIRDSTGGASGIEFDSNKGALVGSGSSGVQKSIVHLDEPPNNSDQPIQPHNGDSNTSQVAQPPQLAVKRVEMELSEFLKTASAHLNKKYSGDPLGLASFIDSVRLIEPLATTPELKNFHASLVKTKIDKRARYLISESDDTVDLIIAALKRNIARQLESNKGSHVVIEVRSCVPGGIRTQSGRIGRLLAALIGSRRIVARTSGCDSNRRNRDPMPKEYILGLGQIGTRVGQLCNTERSASKPLYPNREGEKRSSHTGVCSVARPRSRST